MPLHLLKTAPSASERSDPLDDLYARHASGVRRWARRLAGPSADLEDLVHDVFVVAFRRGFRSGGEGSIKAWLFRITHHVVRRRRRRALIRSVLFGSRKDEMAADTPQASTPYE